MPRILGNSDVRFSRAYLLYDSSCGPCTRFMKLAKALDLHGKLTPVSINGEAAEGLVNGKMSVTRLKNSFHILEVSSGSSEIYSAGDGLVRLTRYTPAGRFTYAIVSRIKFFRQIVRWSYYQATRLRSASKSCSTEGKSSLR